jgi:hypothetical protein
VGNWTDPERHLAGNIRAFDGISSEYKWLETHTGNHLGAFYEPDHIEMPRVFLDYFLFDRRETECLVSPVFVSYDTRGRRQSTERPKPRSLRQMQKILSFA